MRYFRHPALLVACIVFALGLDASAQACAIDQRPSVAADGLLAQINRSTPRTAAAYAAWSYFFFPQSFRVGHMVTLSENRAEVARSLEPSALQHPWAWVFGDGTEAVGWTVRHAYARPGPWRISVYAYDPLIGRWTMFDQVLITTTPR